jgi:hypothetical protein
MFSQTSSMSQALAVTDIFVFPKQFAAGYTYICMSVIVEKAARRTMCGKLNIAMFIYARGRSDTNTLMECELGNFFEDIQNSGYVPVVFDAPSILKMEVALIPTMPDRPLSVMAFSFVNGRVHFDRDNQDSKTSYAAPTRSSASTAVFPTYQQFSQFSKNAMVGMKRLLGRSRLTQDGVSVRVKPRMAQNTQHNAAQEIQFFMSGDPNMPTHWLTMIRISLSDTFTTTQSASQQVDASVTVYQTCDRRSCLGCVTGALQGMCYAAQQCSIVNCIGTVVNQIRPLCNLGLSLASTTNEMLALTLGAWMIFTDSYSSILKMSLQKEAQDKLAIEWVDDAFFGYVCSAKDKGGQVAALLTSAIGAGLISKQRSIDMNGDRTTLIDSRSSAKNTIILNGVNSFLYQVHF